MRTRIEETLELFFPNEMESVLVDPLLFGSFKNALNDDDEPKLYEDYGTYEVVYKIFKNVKKKYLRLYIFI